MHSHRQLYEFAHRALPQILMSAPAQFFMILSGERAGEFLNDIWSMVNDSCQKAGEPFDPVVAPWKAHTLRLGNYPAVIVEMPPPKETTEAHAVCVVLLLDIEQEQRDPQDLKLEYFTLEQNEMSSTQTMLCGWKFGPGKDGPTHANYGEGVKPGDWVGFAQAVKKLLQPQASA